MWEVLLRQQSGAGPLGLCLFNERSKKKAGTGSAQAEGSPRVAEAVLQPA